MLFSIIINLSHFYISLRMMKIIVFFTKYYKSNLYLGPFNKYCYLCTTLEEHEKHLLRTRELRLKKKPMTRKKHRVTFIAPSPTVAKKPKTPVPEKEEILYKVVVKTGKHPRAGLSADAKVAMSPFHALTH